MTAAGQHHRPFGVRARVLVGSALVGAALSVAATVSGAGEGPEAPGIFVPSTGSHTCFGRRPGCTPLRGPHEYVDAVLSPDSRTLYLLGDGLAVLSRDAVTGDLQQLAGQHGCLSQITTRACTHIGGEPSFFGAVRLEIAAGGRLAYAGFLSGRLQALRRDPVTGALTPVRGHGGCVGPDTGCIEELSLGDWRLVPDGGVLLLPSSDRVRTARPDAATGHLRLVRGRRGCVSVGARPGCTALRGLRAVRDHGLPVPLMIALSDDGRSMLVMDARGAIALLARDPLSGAARQLRGRAGCFTAHGDRGCRRLRGDRGAGLAAYLDGGRRVLLWTDDSACYGETSNNEPTCSGEPALAGLIRSGPAGGFVQPSGPKGCVRPRGGEGCARGDIGTLNLDPPIPGRHITVARDGRSAYLPGGHSLQTVTVAGAGPGLRLLALPNGCPQGAGDCAPSQNALCSVDAFTLGHDPRWAYALSGETVVTLQRDPASGALRIARAPYLLTPCGSLRAALAVDPSGQFAYQLLGALDTLTILHQCACPDGPPPTPTPGPTVTASPSTTPSPGSSPQSPALDRARHGRRSNAGAGLLRLRAPSTPHPASVE